MSVFIGGGTPPDNVSIQTNVNGQLRSLVRVIETVQSFTTSNAAFQDTGIVHTISPLTNGSFLRFTSIGNSVAGPAIQIRLSDGTNNVDIAFTGNNNGSIEWFCVTITRINATQVLAVGEYRCNVAATVSNMLVAQRVSLGSISSFSAITSARLFLRSLVGASNATVESFKTEIGVVS